MVVGSRQAIYEGLEDAARVAEALRGLTRIDDTEHTLYLQLQRKI